jgi:hypothetical protein
VLRTVQANSIALNFQAVFYHSRSSSVRSSSVLVTRPSLVLRGSMSLDTWPACRYRRCMPSSYLIFDFAADEESAQEARHKVEGWKQGFRLGDKMVIKFEREQIEDEEGQGAEENAEAAKKQSSKSSAKHNGKKKSAKSGEPSKTDDDEQDGGGKVRLFVRLNFSDHEKLSLQRWLDRIPTEEPFKSVDAKIVRHGDPEFATTNELFETLV